MIMETYESREAVEALLSNPAVQAEMVADGGDASSAQIDFLDEA